MLFVLRLVVIGALIFVVFLPVDSSSEDAILPKNQDTLFSKHKDSPAFETLTWQECLREAALNHPDLIAAKEEIIQQEAAKAIVRSSDFPQITSSLNAANARSSLDSSNTFSYGVSGTQLLFDGFKTANNINAASETLKAARENFKFVSSDIRFALRSAYINLLKAQELIHLTEEIHKIRKDNLDLITMRYQSGTEHKGALLTAQANLSRAALEMHQAHRGFAVVQRQLRKELGRTRPCDIRVSGDFDVQNDSFMEFDFEKLAQKHPALLKIRAQKNAAAFDVKSSEGEFWPEVSLTGGVSKTDSRWPPDKTGTSAGVSVSFPLFQGGAQAARLYQSQSIYRERQQQERSLKDAVILDMEQKWNALRDALENVKVQTDFLSAAQERANISQQQYSLGLISFDNWTIIEDDLVNNKKAFLNAQADALLAEADWIQSKGETLEYEN